MTLTIKYRLNQIRYEKDPRSRFSLSHFNICKKTCKELIKTINNVIDKNKICGEGLIEKVTLNDVYFSMKEGFWVKIKVKSLMNDNCDGFITFIVYGDGARIWETQIMKKLSSENKQNFPIRIESLIYHEFEKFVLLVADALNQEYESFKLGYFGR